MDATELKTILIEHAKWHDDQTTGTRANLIKADLYMANLSMANLYMADLSMANLYGANLIEANLIGANLYGAILRGAILRGAILRGAILRGADLYEANLIGANLIEADLSGANLSMANLYGANLRMAILHRADLRGSKGFISFGPIGEGRIGYAVQHADGPMFALGCHWGNLKDTRAAIVTKYGRNSLYEKMIILAGKIVMEEK